MIIRLIVYWGPNDKDYSVLGSQVKVARMFLVCENRVACRKCWQQRLSWIQPTRSRAYDSVSQLES